MFLKMNFLKSALPMAMAASLVACASTVETVRDPYAAANYAGAHQLYEEDKIASFRSRPERGPEGRPVVIASYKGIAGARLAHERLEAAQAEKLDGDCERFVRVDVGETLVDISRFCDVPVADLVDFNPTVENPYFVDPGQVVEIPFQVDGAGTAFGFADEVAGLYTIQPGDTLNKIAYRYDVSTGAIASLNPNVAWADLQSGDRLRLPETATPIRADRPVSDVDVRWEGYGNSGVGLGSAGHNENAVTALMPYNLKPVNASAEISTADPKPRFFMDGRFAKAGSTVGYTIKNLPADTQVTIYKGDNVQKMKPYKTLLTDGSGVVQGTVRIKKKKASPGGIILKAVPEGGEPVYSGRLGVTGAKDAADTNAKKNG